MTKRQRVMFRIAATGLSLVITLLMVNGPHTDTLVSEAADSTIPSFELVTFGGEVFTEKALQGEPTLLVFWAPWCNVCQRELPLLEQFYRQTTPPQVRILLIGFADTRANVEEFVKSHPKVFVVPTAYDEDRWVARAFKVTATPTYVLLDGQGTIALVHRGGGLLQSVRFREVLSLVNR